MDAPMEIEKMVEQGVTDIFTTTGYGVAAFCCVAALIIIVIAYIFWPRQQKLQ